jgi:hypothetical protein
MQLMLDIGLLNTDLPEFWLKDHLAGAADLRIPATPADASQNESVRPPEFYFSN